MRSRTAFVSLLKIGGLGLVASTAAASPQSRALTREGFSRA